MKYRKKPVVVEAVQWDGNNRKEIEDFLKDKHTVIIEHTEGRRNQKISLEIWTHGTTMMVKIGDYIVESKGSVYNCKPYVFKKTYEPFVEEGEEENDT